MDHDEEWRYVPNFPEYVVSNMGHIRRAGPNRGRPLTKSHDDQGNVIVHLRVDPHEDPRRFHLDRIVAAAFLNAFGDNMMLVDITHKDGNLDNCRADNLEWTPR